MLGRYKGGIFFSQRLGVRVDFSEMVTERRKSVPQEEKYESKGLG